MKIKERYVYLECFGCAAPGRSRYTTHKRLKATYKLDQRKYCPFCRKHWAPQGEEAVTTLAPQRRALSRVRIVEDLASVVSIFEEPCNAVVLARHPDLDLQESAARFAQRDSANCIFHHNLADITAQAIARELGVAASESLAADLALWCEVVGDLTGCDAVGVRLACTTKAMCPSFHVDRVSLRAVCTYLGPGTELVDGPGIPLGWRPGADESAIDAQRVIRALPMQMVLLKGEAWAGNEGAGVLHRSPAVPPGERRLVLTIDAL